MQEELKKAVEANKNRIGKDVANIAVRETEHQSSSDSKPHITVQTFDQDGKFLETMHLYTDQTGNDN
ncbi:hypothetical protein GGR57DRAFT_452072 [Xylariaceae sp. FL1272]|nr:hypothetical protein GGR57DRAFT_452072 [Xylariaceae sp. FL1272]